MALRNPKVFGLNVLTSLADVIDKEEALNSLNLSSRDLNIIRGSQNEGLTGGDWISLSRLVNPIYRTLDSYRVESATYSGLFNNRAGTEGILLGNLRINGALSGNAVRYRYVDGVGVGATVKIADISTSRVSAWSSSASPAIESSPISYGAQVSVKSGGALQFGTQSGTSGPRLRTSLTPIPKEFDSEFPTSKISCTIGGQSVVLYAMKGIPLSFTGFFRDLDVSINLTNLINDTPASWKIVETGNANNFVNFRNIGGILSRIKFTSSISRERYIQFYYNPNNISKITLTSANIAELPAVKLQSATELNFSLNQLRNFPNFNFIAPNLQILNLISNPLSQSANQNERKLNSNVITKIPTTLRQLYLGQTFFGSIQQNIISTRFTQLTVLNLNRVDGPYYHPDNDDANCELPNVPNTCQTYFVRYNDFRAFGTTVGINSCNVKDLTNLASLDLTGNYNLSGALSIPIGNDVISSISCDGTGLSLPSGLSGKNSFTSLSHTYCRNAGPLIVSGNYLYENCNSLTSISLNASNVTGRLPKFTNSALTYLDIRTNLTGGSPDNDETFVIPERTFEKCTNLLYMYLSSGNLLTAPIHPNAFSYTPKLIDLRYNSSGRTTGNIPSLGSNTDLTTLVLSGNNFTGTMPNLASNKN